MSKINAKPYTIIRDKQEKAGYWEFDKYDKCMGTVVKSLKTGDYTIDGYEENFTIERKRNTSEFAQNLYQDRFSRELERMSKMEHPYLFLEFTWNEMVSFPAQSGVPKFMWNKLKTTSSSLIKRYHELRIKFPKIRVEFVGNNGKLVASSLFKRVLEFYNG